MPITIDFSKVETTAKKIQTIIDGKLSELKGNRNDIVDGTLEVTTALGNTFVVDTDITNRSTMNQALTNAANAGLPDTDTINWKMGDNVFRSISYAEMKEIGIVIGEYLNTNFQHEASKVAEVNACGADTACIIAVVW